MNPIWLFLLIVSVASCVRENNPTIELGDATIGQQLIDLKVALDGDAISEEEYVVVKANLIASSKFLASEEGD